MIAARRVHGPSAVAQAPSPGLESTSSAVELTVKSSARALSVKCSELPSSKLAAISKRRRRTERGPFSRAAVMKDSVNPWRYDQRYTMHEERPKLPNELNRSRTARTENRHEGAAR